MTSRHADLRHRKPPGIPYASNPMVGDGGNPWFFEELVERSSYGEAPAIDALLEQMLPQLLALVRVLGSPLSLQHESCSDLIQSVCREVLESTQTFEFEYRDEAKFRSWVFLTTLSKIKQRYEATPPLFGAAMGNDALERFVSAFLELSPEDQKIVFLSRIMGFDHAEIAERTGTSVAEVRTQLTRALARLGRLMGSRE